MEHMSPSSWDEVVSALGRISSVYSIPVDKLDALVVAAKLIPELYEREHNGLFEVAGSSGDNNNNNNITTGNEKQNPNKKQNSSLGADDLLPIFIYCLVMSSVPTSGMQSLVVELDFVCDTQSRYSEVGYFVTTFQASIQHILYMDEVIGESHLEGGKA